jgi:beta-galactosidase
MPYEPGTVKAVGRKNNQVVCEEIIQTSGTPASIKLSVDGKYLSRRRDAVMLK